MLSNLTDLFNDQIKDLYSAENQLLKALPKMIKAAASPELRAALEDHLAETEGHVDRLERVAGMMEIKPGGKKCKAMEGLCAEGAEAIEEEGDESVCDAGLVAAAQRVEHYEISAYGTAIALAKQIDNEQAVELLTATLDEEHAADEKLTEIRGENLFPNAPVSELSASDRSDESGQSGGSAAKTGARRTAGEKRGPEGGARNASDKRRSGEVKGR